MTRVSAGETLRESGPHSYYRLEKGLVAHIVGFEPTCAAYYEPGDIFFVEDSPLSEHLALAECSLSCLDERGRDFERALAARHRDMERRRAQHFEQSAGAGIRERLGLTLAYLGERIGEAGPQGTVLNGLSQAVLGKLVGSTRETVAKTLTEFRASGRVVTGHKHILLPHGFADSIFDDGKFLLLEGR